VSACQQIPSARARVCLSSLIDIVCMSRYFIRPLLDMVLQVLLQKHQLSC
jgi:hypothetical protein